jgi:hypothetical protein
MLDKIEILLCKYHLQIMSMNKSKLFRVNKYKKYKTQNSFPNQQPNQKLKKLKPTEVSQINLAKNNPTAVQ